VTCQTQYRIDLSHRLGYRRVRSLKRENPLLATTNSYLLLVLARHVPTNTVGHVLWAWFVRHSKMRAYFLQNVVAGPSLSGKADDSLHNSSVSFRPRSWSLKHRIAHTVASHPVQPLYHLSSSMVRQPLVPDAFEGLASTVKGRIT
jgi:hypothetical protein